MDIISRKIFLLTRKLSKAAKAMRPKKEQEAKKTTKSEVNKSDSEFNVMLKIPSFSRQSLLNLSIIFSVIGILSLFMLSFLISPKLVSISSISSLQDGAYVKVAGFAFDIDSNSFKLCDSQVKKNSECISVIVSQGTIPMFLAEGDHIYVTGSVRKFNNRPYLYIQGKDIVLIR